MAMNVRQAFLFWGVSGPGLRAKSRIVWLATWPRREFKRAKHSIYQLIGLREQLQENPIFDAKNQWFPVDFP